MNTTHITLLVMTTDTLCVYFCNRRKNQCVSASPTSLHPFLIMHRPYGDTFIRIKLIGSRIKCGGSLSKGGSGSFSATNLYLVSSSDLQTGQQSFSGASRRLAWECNVFVYCRVVFILAANRVKWRHTLLTAVVIKRRRGAKGNWTFIISNWLRGAPQGGG